MTDNSIWLDHPVLITGATGLLGGWLSQRLLALGASVTCIIRDDAPHSRFERERIGMGAAIVRGDIRDQALMERALGEYEIQIVFHLAAQTVVGVANRNPVSTFESNIQGTWTLLEACRRSPRVAQIVVASSDKAYGSQDTLPYAESAPLNGLHPYDVSKSCADLIAQTYANTYSLPVVVTRCGNFYGGGDLNWNRIVPGTIRSILRNQRPIIRSDGQFVRDYFYVEDGVAAYLHLAEQLIARPDLRGQAYNFSNELQITVSALVERILRHMNSDLTPDIRNEATNEIRNQYLTAAKARQELGWRPAFTLDDGLQRTIAWYQEFLAK